ncbi:MAG: protein kinase, partial [Candidatus Acidiferrales bacterium]
IEATIGAGGMGEVYRAIDTRLDRSVAIKILPLHLCEQPGAKQRFEREARAISALQHPNICTLYDVGHQGGLDFLVMEYLEGETLSQRLAKGPLPPVQVLKCGIEICEGLEKAHRNGVVHRDLKPGNIMLTKTGAKLLDFGLAKPFDFAPAASLTSLPTSSKALDAEPRQPLTAEGAIVGTLQYMSPEQLEGKEADERSDIFALGAVLYEMAVGKRVFDGKSQASVIAAILECDPPPISMLRPTSPAALDHVVKTCLAKDRDERWQSVHDVKRELQWIDAGGSHAGVAAPMAARRKPSQIVAWGVAAICFLAAIVFASRSLLRTPQPTRMVRSSLLPPQNSSFLPYNFAISPDGSRLAFVALDADGKTALWVRSLSTPGSQQLTGTEGAQFPFWSPDSRAIGFFAEARLKTVDLTGGGVQVLCDAPLPFGATWSRDGTIVFAPSLHGPLNRVPARGGTPAATTKLPRPGSIQAHRWPFFLPDGKHFLYIALWSSPADPRGDGIYLGSLDSGDAKLISPELTGNVLFASGHLLYVRDRRLVAQPFDPGRLQTTGPAVPISEQELERHPILFVSGASVSQEGVLVFQSAADSPSRLVWFDSSGKELGQLPEVGYKDPALSPNGRFLAVSSDDEHNGKHFIRVQDLQRGVSARLTDGGDEQIPVWSRDGKRISFSSAAFGADIYDIAADGSGAPQLLLKGQAGGIPNDWSLDGHIVFMSLSEGHPFPSLGIYSPSNHQVTPFAEDAVEAQFSPDGKWIAYSFGPTGVFVQPFPGPGARIQLSNSGGQARWARNGKQIFYIQRDRKLMAVSFDPQTRSASVPRVLFQTRIVAPNFAVWQYDVAPDGRFLINSLPSGSSSPLTLLTNWIALLQGR